MEIAGSIGVVLFVLAALFAPQLYRLWLWLFNRPQYHRQIRWDRGIDHWED